MILNSIIILLSLLLFVKKCKKKPVLLNRRIVSEKIVLSLTSKRKITSKSFKEMKKIVITLFVSLLSLMAYAGATIKFNETVHNFGSFPESAGKVSCDFEFTNTGNSPLVLQDVKASCGCTTPEWTKTPIAPGKKGVIKATYNATGRPGAFNKTITVKSNAGEIKLIIKGEVETGKPAPVGEEL